MLLVYLGVYDRNGLLTMEGYFVSAKFKYIEKLKENKGKMVKFDLMLTKIKSY